MLTKSEVSILPDSNHKLLKAVDYMTSLIDPLYRLNGAY